MREDNETRNNQTKICASFSNSQLYSLTMLTEMSSHQKGTSGQKTLHGTVVSLNAPNDNRSKNV